jgi:hypothetical protein
MKNYKHFIYLAGFLIMFLIPVNGSAADQSPWFVETFHDDMAVLEPGTTTYCDKNFMVENTGDSKSYSLTADYPLSGGWDETRGVRIDDARIINSTAGTSKIKVHCK